MKNTVPDTETEHAVRRLLEYLDRAGIGHNTITLQEVGAYEPRWVHGVLSPLSVPDVTQIITAANDFRVPLHPYSTGKNWGFGSKSPVRSGGFLLDLSGLNAITSIDLDAGTATIEPGVDQHAMSDALEGSSWILNVTSAGGATGILGNALENGVGSYRKRTEDLLRLEAVLGSGKFVHVEPYSDAENDLTIKDFVQSNIGIVTGATISLVPKPDQIVIASVFFPTNEIFRILESCRRLMDEKVIAGIPKIFNREDDRSQLIIALVGNAIELKEKSLAVCKIIAPEPLLYFSGQKISDEVIQSQQDLFAGIPTDRALRRYIMKPGPSLDPDTDAYMGLRLFAVAVPLSAQHIAWCVQILQSHADDALTSVEYTWNVWSPSTLGLVLYVHFARNAAGMDAAAELHDALFEQFSGQGIWPYRYDIDHMDQYELNTADMRNRRSAIKKRCDPNNLIAPGKYL